MLLLSLMACSTKRLVDVVDEEALDDLLGINGSVSKLLLPKLLYVVCRGQGLLLKCLYVDIDSRNALVIQVSY